ncbi:MAG: hypothetical protein LZ174_08565 [Thaumarchaeota archaeon]|jgi:hypothetical protein|nr:hypothetical protein [Candidatus Geocrenenecus arthurdayi]
MYCIEDGVEVVVAGDENSKCTSNLVISEIERSTLKRCCNCNRGAQHNYRFSVERFMEV